MQALIKKFFVLCLVLCSAVVFAADKPRDFQHIIKSGSLRIGVSIFPPWVMRAKSGDLIGSEIDMGRRLAADMGLAPDFGLYEWQQLIPALNKGDIDIIISGMAIKPNRALKVNFSRPYGDAGIGLVANTGKTKNFKSLDELKSPEVKIGVLAETVSADVAKRLFSKATLVLMKTQEALEEALLKGELHAVIAANPLPHFLSLKYPGKLDLPLVKPLLRDRKSVV